MCQKTQSDTYCIRAHVLYWFVFSSIFFTLIMCCHFVVTHISEVDTKWGIIQIKLSWKLLVMEHILRKDFKKLGYENSK